MPAWSPPHEPSSVTAAGGPTGSRPQADLLRNLIFMLLPGWAAEVYDEVWRPMERLVGFRNLKGLARVDLQGRGIDVAVGEVFPAPQARPGDTARGGRRRGAGRGPCSG